MLSDRGWLALGVAAGSALAWVLLGEVELVGAAALVAAAVVFAVAVTRLTAPRIEVTRRLSSGLVHEGDQARVDLAVTNRRRLPGGNLTVTDPVGPLGDATFSVGTLAGGAPVTATYQILCKPRGAYEIGPTRVTVSDPLRLSSQSGVAGAVDRLVVYPRVENLTDFPLTRGRDPAVHASRPEFSHRGGEDFYTLREYRIGDDLRFVHWRSSAKRDELMIRQLETPWLSRALVMLDVRHRVYADADCFEQAVRGAASVVRHLSRSGFDADLWAGGTAAIPMSRYAAAMEQLALVQPVADLDLRAVAARLRRSGQGGALVLVTGMADADLLAVHRLLLRDFRSALVLSVATQGGSEAEGALRRGGALTVTVTPEGSWAEAWARLVSRTWLGAAG